VVGEGDDVMHHVSFRCKLVHFPYVPVVVEPRQSHEAFCCQKMRGGVIRQSTAAWLCCESKIILPLELSRIKSFTRIGNLQLDISVAIGKVFIRVQTSMFLALKVLRPLGTPRQALLWHVKSSL
jgi:hypothetical protein